MSVYEDQLRHRISELLHELEKHPRDTRLVQKLGECHQKLGDLLRAAEYFLQLAALYESDGYFLKTAAVAKQVLRLRPGHLGAHEILARAYQALGLHSDAVPHLSALADAHARAGNADSAMTLLERIRELDPNWRPTHLN